jgi:glutathione S-transferase
MTLPARVDPREYIDRSHALLRVVDNTLADARPFIVGTEPTIADLALYAYTARTPAVRAWLRRVESLPGFVPMPASPIGLAA